MRFAALGRTEWLYRSIEACIQAGHQVAFIGTCLESTESKTKVKDFKELAYKHGASFFIAKNSKELEQNILKYKGAFPEICISVNWKTVISKSILHKFKKGILNAHAGDLPRFRGNACPNWAILMGEKRIVLTLHEMSTELDAGPILFKESFLLSDQTYIQEIYHWMEKRIPALFSRALDLIERKKARFKTQSRDPSKSLRCYPRIPEDSLIDWSSSAEKIVRLVRASSKPLAGAFTYYRDQKLIVWKASYEKKKFPCLGQPGQIVSRSQQGAVRVLSGKGVLTLHEVEWNGKAFSQPSRLILSCRDRLGMNLVRKVERLEEALNRAKRKK